MRYWACPSCHAKDRGRDSAPKLHQCAGLGGLSAPLVEVASSDAKPDARHIPQQREDYIAGDIYATPIMSTRTEHGSGRVDCTVYAPCAVAAAVANNANQPGGSARPIQDGGTFYHRFRNPDYKHWADIARKLDARMAWSASAVIAYTLGNEILAGKHIDLSADTFKAMLYTSNAMTPSNATTTAATSQYNGAGSQWVNSNECSTSGTYTNGTGLAVNTPAVTQNFNSQGNNTMTFTATSISSATGATLTTYGMLVQDSSVSNYGVSFHFFGGQQVVTSGSLTISINANGLAVFAC